MVLTEQVGLMELQGLTVLQVRMGQAEQTDLQVRMGQAEQMALLVLMEQTGQVVFQG